MCGIVGYIGKRDSVPIIMDALQRLEYRGYDSAGIAVIDAAGHLTGSKAEGKLANLAARLRNGESLHGTTGVGHTRWATHGRPSDANAHPHLDCSGHFAVIHNGIIENYASLREQLLGQGHQFRSETDTEVLAHLIESHYNGDLEQAIRHTLAQVRGAFALGVISQDSPETLVFARNGATPLIVGLGEGEMFVASDIPAMLQHTRKVVILQEGEIVTVGRDGYALSAFDGTPIEREVQQITWDATSAEKSGFKHFMLKEIFEQPNVIKETLAGRIDEDHDVQLGPELKIDEIVLRAMTKISITGCGTAYNAGMVGMYLMRSLCKIPVEMELASEFRYGDRAMDARTLTIAMSQSGETADTIEAVKIAKDAGTPVIAISNVVGSHLMRLADATLLTRGGPEISVAATKTYVSQAVAATLLALYLARVRKAAPLERLREIAEGTKLLPAAVDVVVNTSDQVKKVARKVRKARSVLFLGRYVNFPTALEGALKLKEISYIHAEGYAAGEMKHGPIALLDAKTPVIGVVTEGRVREKILSNIAESKAREAPIILVANHGDDEAAALADHVLWVPRVDEMLSPIVNVIPLQLLAYHIADIDGKDVDQPRNLAKTVTVE
ncbi:glutamine--fructose-6-phosphate aminotransferase [isomerizing] [Vulcanimicrobium alpinum]|uniref:Glutamine--fructose-6-phosphate aminotransferase [isomerizing] n=1 Tax=Vulcanimicrobium alpinum TaxID=3016050 RepID=A0AAN1XY34_UNVUL|nr:glutamine--fructose-6-phosphate transaminase (isomerizing) [Vulcanimicrobium alpinum]BDE06473.1 glutamine--fructose-6-phosphate aminotransferase [isomerizing] [Vulcanimicrobium alpinum]